MLTFETKCYENDWEFILRGTYLRQMIERCNFPFSKRMVYINNVNNLKQVVRHAEKMKRKGIIDDYLVVSEHAREALAFFDIDIDSFRGGYYYSIAELVSIYLCQTEFLIHFSSDSFPDSSMSNWISEAIAVFEKSPEVMVANPTWDFNFTQAKEESFGEIDNFYLGYGFSDQCYMIRTADFRQTIYNEQHPFSERYPAYGGQLFEKRVDSYMRNHERMRITSRESVYIHQNFSGNRIERFRRKLQIARNPPV